MKRLPTLKVAVDAEQISKNMDVIFKNRKAKIALMSLPATGWMCSEIKRVSEKKKYREHLVLYQDAIRKHQAQINILKRDKEKEAYKRNLLETLHANNEGKQNG